MRERKCGLVEVVTNNPFHLIMRRLCGTTCDLVGLYYIRGGANEPSPRLLLYDCYTGMLETRRTTTIEEVINNPEYGSVNLRELLPSFMEGAVHGASDGARTSQNENGISRFNAVVVRLLSHRRESISERESKDGERCLRRLLEQTLLEQGNMPYNGFSVVNQAMMALVGRNYAQCKSELWKGVLELGILGPGTIIQSGMKNTSQNGSGSTGTAQGTPGTHSSPKQNVKVESSHDDQHNNSNSSGGWNPSALRMMDLFNKVYKQILLNNPSKVEKLIFRTYNSSVPSSDGDVLQRCVSSSTGEAQSSFNEEMDELIITPTSLSTYQGTWDFDAEHEDERSGIQYELQASDSPPELPYQVTLISFNREVEDIGPPQLRCENDICSLNSSSQVTPRMRYQYPQRENEGRRDQGGLNKNNTEPNISTEGSSAPKVPQARNVVHHSPLRITSGQQFLQSPPQTGNENFIPPSLVQYEDELISSLNEMDGEGLSLAIGGINSTRKEYNIHLLPALTLSERLQEVENDINGLKATVEGSMRDLASGRPATLELDTIVDELNQVCEFHGLLPMKPPRELREGSYGALIVVGNAELRRVPPLTIPTEEGEVSVLPSGGANLENYNIETLKAILHFLDGSEYQERTFIPLRLQVTRELALRQAE